VGDEPNWVNARRTTSTFSCDIARAVSRSGLVSRQRHGFQEPFPVFKNLALPALRVQVAAARSA
jgi:hypothetical protein